MRRRGDAVGCRSCRCSRKSWVICNVCRRSYGGESVVLHLPQHDADFSVGELRTPRACCTVIRAIFSSNRWHGARVECAAAPVARYGRQLVHGRTTDCSEHGRFGSARERMQGLRARRTVFRIENCSTCVTVACDAGSCSGCKNVRLSRCNSRAIASEIICWSTVLADA